MSLEIQCDVCGKELNEPGALLITPPVGHTVFKHHICVGCFTGTLKLLLLQSNVAEATNVVKEALKQKS